MRRRYELNNRQWERIRRLLPPLHHQGGPGHPWRPHRRLINGILWILHTGAPWRDLPERYGPWQTAFDRFNRWRQDGTWVRLWRQQLRRLDRSGRIGRDLWVIDASLARASRAAGGARHASAGPRRLGGSSRTQLEEPEDHALGRSKGGLGTKVHILCDGHGIGLAIFVTAGQRHESTAFEAVMGRVALPGRPGGRFWPAKEAADMGYHAKRIRAWLRRHHIEPIIPTPKKQKPDPAFDKASYRRRNIVERLIGWLKECRRLGTRYEKLAVNFVTFWIVAMIHRMLLIG
jgi:transposase